MSQAPALARSAVGAWVAGAKARITLILSLQRCRDELR